MDYMAQGGGVGGVRIQVYRKAGIDDFRLQIDD